MSKIYVVEGRHDYNRLKEIDSELNILMTNGAAITEAFLEQLEQLSLNNEIILLLDADNAGERLRRIITNRLPSCKHIFINKENSTSYNGKKVGIEHVNREFLKASLDLVKEPLNQSDLTFDFLLDLGLIGDKTSKIKRLKLCEYLSIGYVNGKNLLPRLTLFGYKQKDILEALNELET
ncbi:MAG: ribonuclease M5 [Acholeplasma sp.]|nr:ribonuclease M5 [Acholeplasma sp.]